MNKKVVFILGFPGCGKSTAAYYIRRATNQYGKWFAFPYDDYEDLKTMYKQDTEEKFRSADFEGFEVLDYSVFEDVLKYLAWRVERIIDLLPEKGIITIEFARRDYVQAFKLIQASFLRDAYYLCLFTDLETAKKRNRDRVSSQIASQSADEHFVPEHVLEAHYHNTTLGLLPTTLLDLHGVDNNHILFIDNGGSLHDLQANIDIAIGSIILQGDFSLQETQPLPQFLQSSNYSDAIAARDTEGLLPVILKAKMLSVKHSPQNTDALNLPLVSENEDENMPQKSQNDVI